MKMIEKIKQQISASIAVKESMFHHCIEDIQFAATLMINSIRKEGKIIWCGNGGSAADAQHLATELMGGMTSHDRKPIPSIALTTDSSFITAWSNDTGFESIFSRQIQGLGKAGDVLIGISTSGNSENVLAAVKQAKFKELSTIVFTGNSGGKIKGVPDISINIPSEDTQRIQEAHIMVGQILCGLIEDDLLNK
ncbi:MAG: phosphoheptose isomerase [Candidatus Marinimicrobia bacterium]|nr:phosphoheptose isomerase [Candidatus Neomarinimicrobiota bacterium]|tara:strand:+ start:1537 stop:2118 length:582 start_codon:yes stop_codon:yes gene_type:complete